MKIRKKNIQIELLLTISWLLILFCPTIFASEITVESVQQTEKIAEELSNKWNSDSYRHSIDLFIEASEDWKKLGQFSESADCIGKAAKIYLILNEYEHSINQLKPVLEVAVQSANTDIESELLSLFLG